MNLILIASSIVAILMIVIAYFRQALKKSKREKEDAISEMLIFEDMKKREEKAREISQSNHLKPTDSTIKRMHNKGYLRSKKDE